MSSGEREGRRARRATVGEGWRLAGLVLLGLGGIGLGGCTSGSEAACTFHEECPADQACVQHACRSGCRSAADCSGGGQCGPDGRCTVPDDGGLDPGDPDGGEGPVGVCLPTIDGVVTRAEFPLGPGLGAAFLAGAPAVADDPALLTVDLLGAPDGGGERRRWSLGALPAAAASSRQYLDLLDPAALPAGPLFAGADYAVALADTPGVLAFFDRTPDALLLLGLADAAGRLTVLRYEPAVTVLRFPVVVGDVWQTRTHASGPFLGALVEVEDEYRTEVRAAGTAVLPAGELPVVQLLTTMRRTFPAAGFSQVHTAVDFLGECGGFVAHAVSAEGVSGLPTKVRAVELLLPSRCEENADCGRGGRCGETGFCRPAEPEAPAALCVADGDRIISDAEFPVQPGLSGLFRVAPQQSPVPVDLAGSAAGAGGAAGAKVWDLRGEAGLPRERVEETLAVPGSWFAASFPDATHAALLDESSGTLAVFRRVPGALQMLGLASRAPDQTLLVYDTPVDALRFPLAVGDAWQVVTTARGTLAGQATTLAITYRFAIDAHGTVRLPAGDVPVLRQRIESVQQVSGASYAISRRTVLFVAECLGGVARALSLVNEPQADFGEAAELVRLTVPRCLADLQCPAGRACRQGLCLGTGGGEGEGEGEGTEGEGEGTEGEGEGAEGEGEGAGTEGEGEGEGTEGEGEGAEGEGEGAEGEGEGAEGEGEGGVPLCNPLGDGVLQRDEVLLAPGLHARFVIGGDDAAGVPVELAGVPCAAGRCWDLSDPLAGDEAVSVDLLGVGDAWFAEDFPTASYASLLDRARDWLGVFRLTGDALELLGAASVDSGGMRSLYDPPVTLYRFPLDVGDSWTVETSQSGYWGWTPVMSDDTYTVRVAARGEVTTPAGTFRALQVVTRIEQQVPFTVFGSSQVVHTFISECNGIVARVTSLDDEPEEFFDRAAQVERLTVER